MANTVIVIAGPTCSGKTKIGIRLASQLRTEIISADSRQFYNKLNIGTAKPSIEELKKVKHHFIDSLDPEDDYNVSRYLEEAEQIINTLLGKNKIPLVVGGSGLYLKILIDGIAETADKDDDYRAYLLNIKSTEGNISLYELLQKADPVSASKMLPQNWKRVMRALEVNHITGRPIWEHHQQQVKKNSYKFCQFGLNWKREVLYKNIDDRVDQMISNGLIDEVKNLLIEGYIEKLNSMNTVGYKEIISFLKNEISFDRAIELIKRNSRRYAKRQLTWFRKDKRIKWIDINSIDELDIAAEKIFQMIYLSS